MSYVAPIYPRVKFEDDARRKLSKEDIAEIKSLHSKGWLFNRIGKEFGVSGRTAHYHSDPDWAREQNEKRYKELKKGYEQQTSGERKERYYKQNQRFLERTKSDPLLAEFKAKHTYKWKKNKYHTDQEFKTKTRTQAMNKYYRDKEIGLEPRKRTTQLKEKL